MIWISKKKIEQLDKRIADLENPFKFHLGDRVKADNNCPHPHYHRTFKGKIIHAEIHYKKWESLGFKRHNIYWILTDAGEIEKDIYEIRIKITK